MNDLLMHATKVFLAVIGPRKLLVANEALKRLFSRMSHDVSRAFFFLIAGVRTKRAFVSFVGDGSYRAAFLFDDCQVNCSGLLELDDSYFGYLRR